MATIPKSVRVIQIVQIILCLIGIGIAGFLWYAHRANISVPCTSDGGCEIVAQSKYSKISIGPYHNIPVSLLGLTGYVLLFSLAMLKLGTDSKSFLKLVAAGFLAIALGGTAYSLYLQYVSFVIIGAHCIWCISSACNMTIILITSIFETNLLRKGNSTGFIVDASLGTSTSPVSTQ